MVNPCFNSVGAVACDILHSDEQAIRYALRGGGQAMAAQAQPLLTALPEHFASSRQSCYLYAASELVKTFGSNLAYEQALGEIAVLGPNLEHQDQYSQCTPDITEPGPAALEPLQPLNAGSMLSRMLGEACAGLRTLAQFNEDPELADDTFLLV